MVRAGAGGRAQPRWRRRRGFPSSLPARRRARAAPAAGLLPAAAGPGRAGPRGARAAAGGGRDDGGGRRRAGAQEGAVAARGGPIPLREPADLRRRLRGVGPGQQREPLLQHLGRLALRRLFPGRGGRRGRAGAPGGAEPAGQGGPAPLSPGGGHPGGAAAAAAGLRRQRRPGRPRPYGGRGGGGSGEGGLDAVAARRPTPSFQGWQRYEESGLPGAAVGMLAGGARSAAPGSGRGAATGGKPAHGPGPLLGLLPEPGLADLAGARAGRAGAGEPGRGGERGPRRGRVCLVTGIPSPAAQGSPRNEDRRCRAPAVAPLRCAAGSSSPPAGGESRWSAALRCALGLWDWGWDSPWLQGFLSSRG